jgi:hypothetical protein
MSPNPSLRAPDPVEGFGPPPPVDQCDRGVPTAAQNGAERCRTAQNGDDGVGGQGSC